MKNLKKLIAKALMVTCATFMAMSPLQVFAASTLVWPVPGHTGLSRGYYVGQTPETSHYGLDVCDGSIDGADVLAAMSGTVVKIYMCSENHYGSYGDCNGYGTGLVIKGDDGRYYEYAHMKGGSIPSYAYRTCYVTAGQKIGEVGNTGNSSGSHLHFAIGYDEWCLSNTTNPSNESYSYSTSPTPVEVSLSWNNSDLKYDTKDAYMYIEANTNVSGSFTEAGITVWNGAGAVIGTKSEDPKQTGTKLNIWYTLSSELGLVLNEGSNYSYQFYVVFNGQKYTSDKMSFTTKGQKENSWDEELTVKSVTYGSTLQPTAKAKYGTAVFTYSTEENGEYTSVAPTDAGHYYVKATVAGTDEYKGLEAIAEADIEKARANALSPKPEKIEIVYGTYVKDVALPEGWIWNFKYNTYVKPDKIYEVNKLGYLGAITTLATDSNHIDNETWTMVYILPKDLSSTDISDINKDTDLNNYVIKDGDTILTKDKDYTIVTAEEGDSVTVTVTFEGNYTGEVTTTYSTKVEEPEKPSNPEEISKPTDDKKPTETAKPTETTKPTDTNKTTNTTDTKKTAVETKKQSKTANTSDDSNVLLYLGIASVSLIACVGTIVARKKLS